MFLIKKMSSFFVSAFCIYHISDCHVGQYISLLLNVYKWPSFGLFNT